MKKRTWCLRGNLLTSLALACGLAGQMACPEVRGNEQILKSFSSFENHFNSAGGLVQGSDGALYGVIHAGFFFKVNVDGSGFNILHGFGTNSNDATNPIGPLVLGADKALYGISGGGAYGMGAVFKLNEDGGGYKLLHSFTNLNVVGQPSPARLLQGKDGALYGTTYLGGTDRFGEGTIFKLNPDGTGYQVLHRFGISYKDGANPEAELVQGSDGALYGTTSRGGGYAGSVFRLNPDGSSYKVLHSFGSSTNDGASPQAGLIQGNDGVLYGTTTQGGSGNAGTVFRLNLDGSGYSVFYSFKSPFPSGGFGSQPAQYPKSALAQTVDGALYGTTSVNKGAVFRLNPDGTGYVLVHVFGSFFADGLNPQGSLLLGNDGALYGVTSEGGSDNGGTVFRITMAALTKLPFAVSIAPLVGGTLRLGFDGVVGATYRLDASTNLLDWVTMGTVFNESGLVQFLDANAAEAPQRFYRAVWVP